MGFSFFFSSLSSTTFYSDSFLGVSVGLALVTMDFSAGAKDFSTGFPLLARETSFFSSFFGVGSCFFDSSFLASFFGSSFLTSSLTGSGTFESSYFLPCFSE